MAQGTMEQGKVITVKEWGDTKRVEKTGSEVTSFKAVDANGEVMGYEVWSKPGSDNPLLNTLKATSGRPMTVDLKHSENTHDGQTYHHHTVVQAYVDGQPVQAKQRRSGGGSYKSDEQVALERISIEGQKGGEYIRDLVIAGLIKPEEDDYKLLRDWCREKVTRSMGMPASTFSSDPGTGKSKVTKPTVSPVTPDPTPAPAAEFNNAGTFLKYVYDTMNFNKSTVLKILGATKADEITDYNKAWGKIQEYKELGGNGD